MSPSETDIPESLHSKSSTLSTLETDPSIHEEVTRLQQENQRLLTEKKSVWTWIESLKDPNLLLEADKHVNQVSALEHIYTNLSQKMVRLMTENEEHTRNKAEVHELLSDLQTEITHLRRHRNNHHESTHATQECHTDPTLLQDLENSIQKASEKLVIFDSRDSILTKLWRQRLKTVHSPNPVIENTMEKLDKLYTNCNLSLSHSRELWENQADPVDIDSNIWSNFENKYSILTSS